MARYQVFGDDGTLIGDTDLDGVSQWFLDRKIDLTTSILDSVTGRKTTVEELLAHQIAAHDAKPTGKASAPPVAGPALVSGPGGVKKRSKTSLGIGGIALWVGIALAIAPFSKLGGFAMSVWTLFYAIRLYRDRDPNRVRALIWAILGVAIIIGWTAVKISDDVNRRYGLIPHSEEQQTEN